MDDLFTNPQVLDSDLNLRSCMTHLLRDVSTTLKKKIKYKDLFQFSGFI